MCTGGRSRVQEETGGEQAVRGADRGQSAAKAPLPPSEGRRPNPRTPLHILTTGSKATFQNWPTLLRPPRTGKQGLDCLVPFLYSHSRGTRTCPANPRTQHMFTVAGHVPGTVLDAVGTESERGRAPIHPVFPSRKTKPINKAMARQKNGLSSESDQGWGRGWSPRGTVVRSSFRGSP